MPTAVPQTTLADQHVRLSAEIDNLLECIAQHRHSGCSLPEIGCPGQELVHELAALVLADYDLLSLFVVCLGRLYDATISQEAIT